MRNSMMFRRMASLAIAGLLTAALIGLAAIVSPVAAACRSLEPLVAESLFTIWQQAVASGDARRLGELYAPDAVVLGPATTVAASTGAAHNRELKALAALGPMTAIARTVATGCENIRDYGTMTEAGRTGGRRTELRYSRVYELRGGRWLITLEHVSIAAGASGGAATLAATPVPRPVPAVAGYLQALPPRAAHDPIAGILARSQPVMAVGAPGTALSGMANAAPLPPLSPVREIAMAPGAEAARPTSAAPPPAAVPATRIAKPVRTRWMQDLPGFRTTQ